MWQPLTLEVQMEDEAVRLPVMEEVVAEARRRGVELIQCPTPEAVRLLEAYPAETNAILYLTC
jgi:hypothetical protein